MVVTSNKAKVARGKRVVVKNSPSKMNPKSQTLVTESMVAQTSVTKVLVTPPTSPAKKILAKRVVVDYDNRKTNEKENYYARVNKTASGILLIRFSNLKSRYTYMEDMERKDFLKENRIHFTMNFKVCDSSGNVKDQMQTIGQTGKSARFATCFVHIIADEEEYNNDEESYLKTLITKLVESLNTRLSERKVHYETIEFKVPTVPFEETMTSKALPTFFSTEDCFQLFNFLYSKDIKAYADTEQLFLDFPHITEEFLGENTEKNKETLMKVHQNTNV